MSIKDLQEYTRFAKYARYMPDQKRRETWDEQVSRVFDMHKEKLGPELCEKLASDLEFAESMVKRKKVLGSQRALQFGGKPILDKHPRLYNCTVSYCDRPRFFQEGMHLLLCGCGIGFSVQKKHVDKLPNIQAPDENKQITYVIPDSIEGWADAIGVLMSSYFVSETVPFPEYQGKTVTFDYSQIRPAGAPISSGSKAPGPSGLKNSIEKMTKLLNKCCKMGNRLRPIDAYDIMMHSSDAVLSGGVRRCIAEGQRVLVKDQSYKNIEDIEIGDMVSTNDGWKPVINTFIQGKQETVRIVHQDGYLDCTANHRVAILKDHDGNFEWKEAGKLESGDRLFFVHNENDYEGVNKLPEFVYEKPLHSTTCKDIVIPELDEDMAWLLGNIQGDGYVYLTSKSGYVSVACEGTNPEKAEFIASQLSRYGANVKISLPKDEDNCYKIIVKSKQLATYFNSWLKQPKKEIEIPECIKRSSYRIKGAYAQGVLDADGSIGARCQQLVTTVYEKFSLDLKSLLYSMGIVSRTRKLSMSGLKDGWQEKYGNFILNNKDRVNFNESSSCGWKKFSHSYCERMSNSYPKEFFDKIENKPKFWHKTLCSSNNRHPIGSWEKVFGSSNITPIEVISIEKGEIRETFDIEVQDNSCFICEGVLVHNSASICLFSHDDEEMAKAKTGSWFIENPQRGRSNNSVLLIRDETSKDEFMKFIEMNKEFGEPGFVWAENSDVVYNPCFHPETRLATDKGLVKIIDLYNEGTDNNVVIDTRIGKGDVVHKNNYGVEITKASPVKLTQKQANVHEVITEHGYSVKVTENHEFPTNRGRLQLKDLVVGDTLFLQSDEGSFGNFGTYDQGLILGLITGDGCICDNEAFIDLWESDFDYLKEIRDIIVKELKSVNSLNNQKYKDLDWQDQTSNVAKKRIGGIRLYRYIQEILGISEPNAVKERVPEVVFRGSREFVVGYLSGILSADGTINYAVNKKIKSKSTLCIRLSQSNKELLKDIQSIFCNFGIIGRIYLRRKSGNRILPDGKGGKREYNCKDNFELVINRPNSIKMFNNNMIYGRKKDIFKKCLDDRGSECLQKEKFVTKIKSITFDSVTDVYCLYEEKTNSLIASGVVTGNCVEIGMVPKVILNDKLREELSSEISIQNNINVLSGWNFCNLCEINMKKARTEEDFLEACRAASIIGTIQASYTVFDYLGAVTENIVRGEALLGVSMTGMADSPEVAFNPEIQKKGALEVLSTNKRIAEILGINPCARGTCVKPAGSTSCVLGTASGIHPHHAKRYFRRVQANKLETPLQYFMQYNPSAVEESVWSNNKTDMVITFLCEVPDGAKIKNQMDAITLLDNVKLTQQNWVEYGTRHETAVYPWLRHNVSNTISIKYNEWQEVADHIYEHRKWYAGISMLPMSGDKDYPQAPFTAVLTPTEMVREYGDGCMFASGLIVDGLRAFNDNLWAASDCALGYGEILTVEALRDKIAQDFKTNGDNWKREGLSPESPKKLLQAWLQHNVENYNDKVDWVRRAKQFAARYFERDVRKMTYCLKDVTNWKRWCDLKRTYTEVDWSLCYEDSYGNLDNYGGGAGEACAGGACELGDLGAAMKSKLMEGK